LIQTKVDAADGAEEANKQRVRPDLECEKVQTRLVDDADHASEEHEHMGLAFVHHRKQAEELAQGSQNRHQDDAGDEGNEKSQQKGHRPMSRMMRRARL
jgi:hypothetical protein